MAIRTLKTIFCTLFGCVWLLLLGLLLVLAGCGPGSAARAAPGAPVAGHLAGGKPVNLFFVTKNAP